MELKQELPQRHVLGLSLGFPSTASVHSKQQDEGSHMPCVAPTVMERPLIEVWRLVDVAHGLAGEHCCNDVVALPPETV